MSTSSIGADVVAFVLSSSICFDASSLVFEKKEVLASSSSSSSSCLSSFLHANSNFDDGRGLSSSSALFIEISQSEKCSGELGGTSSERPGGAVLCMLSRDAELGARDELGASSPSIGPSSRRRP